MLYQMRIWRERRHESEETVEGESEIRLFTLFNLSNRGVIEFSVSK